MQNEQYKELYTLIKDAFIVMQELVNTNLKNQKYFQHHFEFPQLKGFNDNGMPWLSSYFFANGPVDYSSIFKSSKDENYYENIPAFQKILSYYTDNISDFMNHPYFSDVHKSDTFYRSIFAYNLLVMFDSYMHANNSSVFSEDVLREVVLKAFNRFFNEELTINICIPILLIRFEKDEYTVSENIRVRRLSEQELISSYKIGGYSDTYELFVVSSATHVLELQNYSLRNTPVHSSSAWDYIEAYPLNIIDRWFTAFRIITHYETGYGQILSFPVEWGIREGNLVEIHGVKIHKFPNDFVKERKDTYPTPLVNATDLEKINRLFDFFMDNNANSLNIALKRLNTSYLRENEEDTILDLMIGIESLVTKDDRGEITYKVSTRTALILSTLSQYPYSIAETKKAMNTIYSFRSKVVHGASTLEKSRVIKMREDITVYSVDLARSILEYLILAVAENPVFLDPSNIDLFFLEDYEKKK